jgi:hypothetical protein
MTPRQQAFRQIFARLPDPPRISVETTSFQIHRDLLATSDQLTLMSTLEAELNDRASLAVLPFRSQALRRADGVATRVGWQPTDIHRDFLECSVRTSPKNDHPNRRSYSKTALSRT